MKDDPIAKGKISDEQFRFFAEYLSMRYGLRISPDKRVLLESRLIRRLNALKLTSIEQYIDHTFKSRQHNDEYKFFVDQITTHKTFFFRERYQFDFLSGNLKDYLKRRGARGPVNIWSAGCSTGEEVYTLGMVMNDIKEDDPALDYRILGTDISVPSLTQASRGIFLNELENLPPNHREKYFQEVDTTMGRGLLFNNAEVRSRIQLGTLNLNNKRYNLPCTFDFVFCRNVTIYFDAQTRNEVLARVVEKIRPGGYLFLGHSETALGTTLPLRSVRPTIYQKVH